MWILVISLVLLGIGCMLLASLHRKPSLSSDQPEQPSPLASDSECCGQHEVCEKESLLAAVSRKIEYYDDEELDRFRGRSSNGYTQEECDEFRDILYTMQETDVAGWVRSLQLRGIELPNEIKDEVFLIVGERRASASAPHS